MALEEKGVKWTSRYIDDAFDGPALTPADIAIAPYLFRLNAIGAAQFWSEGKRQRVDAYYQRLSARPSFQTAVSWPDETGGGYEEVGLGKKLAKLISRAFSPSPWMPLPSLQ